jgi:hypothetical protein
MRDGLFVDQKLTPIADKVMARERLTFEDGVTLFSVMIFMAWDVLGRHRTPEKTRPSDLFPMSIDIKTRRTFAMRTASSAGFFASHARQADTRTM